MTHKEYPKSVTDKMHTLAVQRARISPAPLDKSVLDLLEKSSEGYTVSEWLASMLKNLDKKSE